MAKQEIIDAAARAGFVQAWASYQEERGKASGWGGQDLMDLAPPTPSKARTWAKSLIACMEKMNGKTIEAMYDRAAELADEAHKNAPRSSERPTPEDFGHYTAMQALGHGVSWDDSRPSHGFKLPSAEFNMMGARDFYTSVSERFASEG